MTITTPAVYRIMNMDCPMEEALIRKKLANVPGVTRLEFNLMQRLLTVEHSLSSTEAIVAALCAIDMRPEPADRERADEKGIIPETRIPWKKLAVAGLFAALSEIFELAGGFFAVENAARQINGTLLFEWLPLVFALPAIALAGLGTYKKGWLAIANGTLNINALMSVAVTGAVIIGHYPEAAMVMVLFTLSEAIEAKALDRARKAVRDLLALAPEMATVHGEDGEWEEREARRVSVGSLVRVRPGEKIALDGLIVEGVSAVNQAPITGESLPVDKTIGDTVYAGTINTSGSLIFEVTAPATHSTLARIIRAVEEAQSSRAPMQRFVDRFAARYTPAVFLVAILAAIVPPLFMGGLWADSLYKALVILVIGCPCAMVISTPVSIVSGMAAAARNGILIKGGAFLEEGRRLTWLALDKTGTLTHGKPRQTDFIALGKLDAARVALLAASLAARSDHPVSRALAEHAAQQGLTLLPVQDFTALPGRGVEGLIEGRRWRLGNQRMLSALPPNGVISEMPDRTPKITPDRINVDGRDSADLHERIVALEKEGKTVVLLLGEEGAEGMFAVSDSLKASSITALRDLKKLGVRTMMLTGDNEHAAQAIAGQVGVDAFQAKLLPEDKLRVVERLAAGGDRVGMVGDGINDAPALAGANIGFAMARGGTDTAIETADVALMDDDLRKIPRFIRLSRSTHAILVQNIAFALGVKALFFILACAGMASMWMAVFADVGAALIVVANGLRAVRK